MIKKKKCLVSEIFELVNNDETFLGDATSNHPYETL